MASISSLTGSSSSSSIYGNRNYNIISGLASGLDTESLISGVVQSYQQKIQSLQKDHTSLEWQQQAYQSISDKLVEFSRNYTSYAYSTTNLLSASFFNNAVITTTSGTNSALVSASGKTSSNVIINAVRQLATAARYSVTGDSLNTNAETADGNITVTGGELGDLDGQMTLSKLSGSLKLKYGSTSLTLSFEEDEIFEKDGKFDPEAFRDAIVEKLKDQRITTSSGSVVTADSMVSVDVSADGTVSFSDKSSAGNKVVITGASGNLKDLMPGLDEAVDASSNTVRIDVSSVTEQVDTLEYLSDKTLSVTLDGKSVTLQMPSADDLKAVDPQGSMTTAQRFAAALQKDLDNSFGSGRVTVGLSDDQNSLTFQVDDGSTFAISASSASAGKVLGLESGLTSYLDTSKTLGDLKLSGWNWSDTSTGQKVKGTGAITEVTDAQGNKSYVDAAGNAVDKDGYLLDEDGKSYLYSYDLTINGVKIGSYTKNTELNTVLNNINSNTEAGVNVSYSKTTGQFVFTAKDTGSGGRIEIKDGLGAALFGTVDPANHDSSYTEGTDAKFSATINGETMELTRSTNTVDLDGMSVTFNGTFNKDATAEEIEAMTDADKVSFTSKTDADTIVDAVKKMVEDLNTILKEVKNAYSDMPLEQSDGSRYEPLSDEDMADMSDSAIEAYEEKAKTGILFMDSDLSSLYNSLRSAITSSGSDGVTLRSIGISTSYSDGLTTLTLDEQALRQALESDPDKVQEAFTKSKSNGAATDGLMTSLQTIIDRYAATTGEPKGILIEKAGSKYSPTASLDNTMLDKMKDIEEQISEWQDKMSDKVDYYTNKFTQLEVLINQMNSQSSALSGLMSGY